jgi:very-short-patch-repair endonuclease
MQQSVGKFSSKQAKMLYEALCKRGINAQLEYFDGHKTVDLAVLNARLFIEVDDLRHFTDPDQIMRDFKRSHYSDGDDFSTFYVTNQIIDKYLDKVADAIVKVVQMKPDHR